MTLKLLWPDTHHHYHHRKAVANAVRLVHDLQPDELVILGDFIDAKAPARWSRGTADEFAADLQDESRVAQGTLAELREGYDGPIRFLYGNHEDRLARYVNSQAPALKGLVPTVSDLLNFDAYDVVREDQPYRVAPGVVAIHGDRLASRSGMSAYKELQRHGFSVVQGHSHRLGYICETKGGTTRFALECGHLSDVKKAHYLPFPGVADWQMGLGWLRIHKGHVTPGAVHITASGAFSFDGQRYE